MFENYRNIRFEKNAYSEQQIQELAKKGITYDKRLRKQLIREYSLPSSADINILKRFELERKVKFPLEYQNFILRVNGGKPDKNTFIYLNGKSLVIKNFYALNSKVVMYTLEFQNKEIAEIHEIDNKYLIIGGTVNGDHILLNCDSQHKDYGSVYIKYHDDECREILLATSFDIFLSSLVDDE